jgi:hypothetical protein
MAHRLSTPRLGMCTTSATPALRYTLFFVLAFYVAIQVFYEGKFVPDDRTTCAILALAKAADAIVGVGLPSRGRRGCSGTFACPSAPSPLPDTRDGNLRQTNHRSSCSRACPQAQTGRPSSLPHLPKCRRNRPISEPPASWLRLLRLLALAQTSLLKAQGNKWRQ